MTYLKHIISIILSIILSSSLASAYSIPAEYRNQVHNEVEVYILATAHESESWASAILYDQMCNNIGCKAVNGREKLNRQMEYYMQFYTPKMPDMSVP